jgi:CubicO group peptidase (beta-lactamase class C family)
MTQRLPRSTPEAQGITSAGISAFIEAIEAQKLGLHSVMLVRHGEVVAEGWWQPYGPNDIHLLFSLSKSFASSAVGFAVSEGLISLSDKVISFFPDQLPAEVSDNLAAMTVRDLLIMGTGNAEDTTGYLWDGKDGDWVSGFLARPVEHAPGGHFVYNSGATYMCSAIVQKVTGQTLLDYLKPRLLDPLGIDQATWDNSPQGINAGGWGMSITTEDIACFGQLYLQKGVWRGQRLISEEWVELASSKQIENAGNDLTANPDWQQGYGFQFWRCRHNGYRGDGAFGQFCVVLPEQDAVLAITSGTPDMQAVLNLAWEHLLPAMHNDALEPDAAAQAALTAKLGSLSLLPQAGQHSNALAAQISGHALPVAANNEEIVSAQLDFGEDGATLRLLYEGEDQPHTIEIGYGQWRFGSTSMPNLKANRPSVSPRQAIERQVASSGAWLGEQSYVAQIAFYETPFIYTISLDFSDSQQVSLSITPNVGF